MTAQTTDRIDVGGDGAPARTGRLAWLDTARGLALVAMATYHLSWDLEFFGYLAPGTAGTGLLRAYARLIAGSFLFLAGFGLVLGHHAEIRWRAFWIRFGRILAAALAITAATYFLFPDAFIFFGILHAIAAASLLGLPFLRLPVAVVLLCAAASLATPHYLRSAIFDAPALWWVGLSESPPRSNDYVPLLPWFGAFLMGMAACRLYLRYAPPPPGPKQAVDSRWASMLATAGRHSLAIYLLHQPVLIALVYLFSVVAPPARPDPAENYRQSCVTACGRTGDAPASYCRTFCDCTLDQLLQRELFDGLYGGGIDAGTDPRVAAISQQCSAEAQLGNELKE